MIAYISQNHCRLGRTQPPRKDVILKSEGSASLVKVDMVMLAVSIGAQSSVNQAA